MVPPAATSGAHGIDSSEGHGHHHDIAQSSTYPQDEPQSTSALFDEHLSQQQQQQHQQQQRQQQPQPQPEDNYLRPDSPASLEDSQSES
ncbi:hypothetical protein BGZ93_008772, partial [Podila epicladia]